ncbi:MAG: PEP-CTERM sorting domain-containing protein, partial [Patescibacteria group bacterium]|nr:PEP-CTERM sorting domain-containing protein [Patescibacteria group bacterium]
APGVYTYETTFDLRGFLVDTAELTVAVARDDSLAGVYLNGQPVSFSQAGYTLGSPFTISSGFIDGINTLSFAVNNGGTASNPHGLRVEVWGTAMVPEPSTILLLGLAGMALLFRPRQRA